ncbi:ATP-binding cassette domain-containing protein [Sinomonas sp. P47F7]|uniref:ABC transporter ATP-binding protein/permease n=1 Tax=Sinomonas sp. P47F7 TaxID=3410987 RepID=UPI003BF5E3A8
MTNPASREDAVPNIGGSASGGAGSPLIRVENLARRFGTAHALTDATFDIHEGEFVAIVGPSGSGKTTLLNVLGLLDTPTGGTYLLKGKPVAQLSARERNALRSREIGFVFQSSYMIPTEPAYLGASLGLRIQNVPPAERYTRVSAVFDSLGLRRIRHTPARSLSGGERQRVALARAIVTRPRIILADEPTGNLDKENTRKVIQDLKELSGQGTTVVVITHDEEVAAAADRCLRLVDGAVAVAYRSTSAAPGRTGPSERPASPSKRNAVPVLDDIADAANSLTARPLRSILLLMVFLLGAGGLVAGAGLTHTASNQIAERLTQAALDEIRFTDPSLRSGMIPTPQEVDGTRNAISRLNGFIQLGVSASIAPADARVSRLSDPDSRNGLYSGAIRLADAGYLSLMEVRTIPANAAQLMDLPGGVPAAIIGHSAAERLGVARAAPGVLIWVGQVPVPVVGIASQSGRDPLVDQQVYLNAAAARHVGNLHPEYVVRTTDGFPAALGEAIPKALAPGAPAGISVNSVADLRNLRLGVGAELGLMITGVSSVLLVLAALTAATAMYLTVQSRIPEIALRRALGMKKRTIASIFILEGTLIGLAGGLAGGVAGTLAVIAVSAASGWEPVLSLTLPLVSVGSGGATGALAALYPALIAARADPASALRS